MAFGIDRKDVVKALRRLPGGNATVREVPCGFAVGLAEMMPDGDLLSLYVVPVPGRPDLVRVEDDGCAVPHLIAVGRLDSADAVAVDGLGRMLSLHGVEVDLREWNVRTPPLDRDGLADGMRRMSAALAEIRNLAPSPSGE